MHASTSRLFALSLFLANLCLQGQAAPAPAPNSHAAAFTLSKSEMLELGRLARVINAAHCPSHRHLQPGNSLTPSPRSLARASSDEDLPSTIEPEARPRAFSANGLERGSNIVASSHDSRMAVTFQKNSVHGSEPSDEVNWYISHSPSSSGLTLSVSSLSDTDSFIKLLSSSPPNNPSSKQSTQKHLKSKQSLLANLPDILFPARLMEQYFPVGSERPMIHHALIQPLLEDGPALVLSLLDLIQSPPVSSEDNMRHGEVVHVKKLDVVGHGLGSTIAFLVSLSVHLHLNDPVKAAIRTPSSDEHANRPVVSSSPLSSPPMDADYNGSIFDRVLEQVGGRKTYHSWWPSKRALAASQKATTGRRASSKAQPGPLQINAKLLSMNRIGDLNFAKWIDQLISDHTKAVGSTLSVTRINSYADPIPHLPATWQGFAHFRGSEQWIDSDPRIVWSCGAGEHSVDAPTQEEAYEGGSCLDRVPMDKTSLLDHAGPFGGTWIGGDEC